MNSRVSQEADMKKFLKKPWFVLGFAVIIVISSYGAYYMTTSKAGEPVKSYTVDQGPVIDYIEETGEVVSKSTQTLSSDATGKIQTLNHEVGDSVKAGDVVLVIEDSALPFQLAGLEARKAGLVAYVNELKKPADTNLRQKLAAATESSRLSLDQLKTQLETQKQLLASGSVSEQVVKDLTQAVDIATANYQALLSDSKLALKGTSKNTLDQAKSEIAAVDSQIQALQLTQNKATLKATISGTVVESYVKLGDYISTGTPVVLIEQLDQLYIEADLLAEDIMSLKIGNRVIISSDSGFEAQGTIRKIFPKAHTKISDLGVEQKRVTVEIDFEQNSQATNQQDVKLGYEYDLKVVLFETTGLRIPDSALFKINDKDSVFVIKDEKAVLTTVEVLTTGVDFIEISGLQPGDKVIQSPSSKLEDGMKVSEENSK